MCIDFDEYHYDGILLVYVYDFFFITKIVYQNWAHNPQV